MTPGFHECPECEGGLEYPAPSFSESHPLPVPCPSCSGLGVVRMTEYPECPFCDYDGPSTVHWKRPGVFMIEPLNPVTPGHQLFIPREHIHDASVDPKVAAMVFDAAASYAGARGMSFNLITSGGRVATQTVFHFHLHYIPRREGDGLLLPWSKVAEAPEVWWCEIHDAPESWSRYNYTRHCAKPSFGPCRMVRKLLVDP